MGFVSGLALVLLTLVGYSSGSVLVGRGRMITPSLLDLVLTLGLWIVALATRNALGKWWAILIWLVIGCLAGALVVLGKNRFAPPGKPRRARPAVNTVNETKLLARIWQSWKAFAAELGDFQGRILLAWFYFVIVTPFGILVRLMSDPLKVRYEQKNSGWLARPVEYPDLDDARRQF